MSNWLVLLLYGYMSSVVLDETEHELNSEDAFIYSDIMMNNTCNHTKYK